jgi:hypothetical protein
LEAPNNNGEMIALRNHAGLAWEAAIPTAFLFWEERSEVQKG